MKPSQFKTLHSMRSLWLDNPWGFIRQLCITGKDAKATTLEDLTPEQVQVIDAVLKGRSIVVLKPRQIGISTAVAAAIFIKWFLTLDSEDFVIQSFKQGSSIELLKKIKQFYYNLPSKLQQVRPISIDNQTQFTLKDTSASVIASGAGDKGGQRSRTNNVLWLTELAFAPNAEEMLSAALPALGGGIGGQLIIESTANYFEDPLFQVIQKCLKKELSYDFYFFPWTQHREYRKNFLPSEMATLTDEELELIRTGVDLQQLKWRRQKISELGEAKFKRDYPRTIEEAYEQSGNAFIEDQFLSSLPRLPVKLNQINYWNKTKAPRDVFCIGVDPSMGGSGDFASIHVVNARTFEIVAGFFSNDTPPKQLAENIAVLSNFYNNARVNMEQNATCGGFVWSELIHHKTPLVVLNNTTGKIWDTNKRNKPALLEIVREAFRASKMTNIDEFTYVDLRAAQMGIDGNIMNKIRHDDNGYSHFDGGISLGLALVAIELERFPREQSHYEWARKQGARR